MPVVIDMHMQVSKKVLGMVIYMKPGRSYMAFGGDWQLSGSVDVLLSR